MSEEGWGGGVGRGEEKGEMGEEGESQERSSIPGQGVLHWVWPHLSQELQLLLGLSHLPLQDLAVDDPGQGHDARLIHTEGLLEGLQALPRPASEQLLVAKLRREGQRSGSGSGVKGQGV